MRSGMNGGKRKRKSGEKTKRTQLGVVRHATTAEAKGTTQENVRQKKNANLHTKEGKVAGKAKGREKGMQKKGMAAKAGWVARKVAEKAKDHKLDVGHAAGRPIAKIGQKGRWTMGMER